METRTKKKSAIKSWLKEKNKKECRHKLIAMDFRKDIVGALTKAGVEEKFAEELLEVPPQREMGDYAMPCFRLAKELKKNPAEIAKGLAEKIGARKNFRAEAKGPYLNFFIESGTLAESVVLEILKGKEKFGLKKKSGKKIIVEYCQANPMKAFHIGHVRNICLGEAIARVLEASGKNVFRMDYGGDVGPHVSKTLYAYQNFWKGKEPSGIEEKGEWLGGLYASGAKAVRENPELEEKMREMVVELEKGENKRLVADWKKLRKESLEYFDFIYRRLDVKFDKIVLESGVEKEGIAIAGKLQEEGFAVEDDGALIVDLEKFGLNKFLVLKSDGAALYSSKDLALAKMKKRKFKADESIVVVGSEQKFYFQQLTKTLELLNEKTREYCKTIPVHYELVMLEEGKMASREGNVITFSELFAKVYSKTLEETRKRHAEWSEKKISSTAKEIALAAIKFGMLAQDKNKVIVFSWGKAASLEGETGPFVQYSYARAKSILRKAGKYGTAKNFSLETAKEKELVSILSGFRKKISEAENSRSPHKIAFYLLELASAFNSFYHEVPVLKAEKGVKEQRLALVDASAQVLENGLKLLNITALTEM